MASSGRDFTLRSLRTVRETLASHRSHQANAPIMPIRQCSNRAGWIRTSFSRKRAPQPCAPKALELPHRPSHERQIDVSKHGPVPRGCIAVISIHPRRSGLSILAMSSSEGCPLSDIQVPHRRSYGFQCRGADRGGEATEQFVVPRASDLPWPESVSQEVKRDIRIPLCAYHPCNRRSWFW